MRIYKNDKVMDIPKSAYNNFYKNAGWSISKDEEHTVHDPQDTHEEEWPEEEWEGVEESDDISKPLSEMNRAELEAHALKIGVDLTGLTNNKQYRDAIKAATM